MTAIAAEPTRTTPGRRHSAFRNLVTVEGRLLVREVVPLLWGAAFPMVMLSVIGVLTVVSSERFVSSNLSCVESRGIMKMGTPLAKSFWAAGTSL